MKNNKLAVSLWLLLIFAGLAVFLPWLKGVLPDEWGTGATWRYVLRAIYALLALSALLLLRRAPSQYGLSVRRLPREAAAGLGIAILPMLGAFGAMAVFSGWSAAVSGAHLSGALALFALATGLSEEFLFRGFFQGEWNRVFPRRFRLGRTRFSWAVFLAAGVFALAHIFGRFNPFEGRLELDFSPVVYTLIAGIIYGLGREYFGGIWAVGLIHGGWNLGIGMYPDSWVGKGGAIAAFMLLGLAFCNVMQSEKVYAWIGDPGIADESPPSDEMAFRGD